MTVTSYQILEDSQQADGSRHIAFEFVFHTAERIIKRFLASSGYDANAGLIAMISNVEQQVIDNEDQNILGLVEQDKADPVTAIPVHPETLSDALRQRRWLRKLVRWAMINRDIKWIRKVLYPVWYEFKFNQSLTINQIANYLGITVAQANKFNDRLTAYHNALAFIDGDDGLTEEVE